MCSLGLKLLILLILLAIVSTKCTAAFCKKSKAKRPRRRRLSPSLSNPKPLRPLTISTSLQEAYTENKTSIN